MKPIITFLLVLFNLPLAEAQINLVPNSSFEDTVHCPTNISGQGGDEIYSMTDWFPAGKSPDYLNSCATNEASSPLSGFGYQYPRTGDAYVGFFTIINSLSGLNYREYLGVQLKQSLIIGTTYYFKGYISAAFGGPQHIRYFSNNIGIKLSTMYFEASQNELLPSNSSTGNIDTIFTDTTNWVPFQFSFTADSAYNYLYIGNFYDDLLTDSIRVPGFQFAQGAYYFVDDLCLSTDSNYCETLLSVYINNQDAFLVYPNPSNQYIFFKNVKFAQTIHLYDLLGRELFTYYLKKEDSSLNISNLPAGNYFIRSENPKIKPIFIQKI